MCCTKNEASFTDYISLFKDVISVFLIASAI